MNAEIVLYQPAIQSGSMVKLADGRIGLLDAVTPSPMPAEKSLGIQRFYVIGIEKEYAAWVLREEIKTVFGIVEAATAATEVAEVA